MKKKLLASSLILLTARIFADPATIPPPVCSNCGDNPIAWRKAHQVVDNTPPGLEAYQAYTFPPGSFQQRLRGNFWWLTGFYITPQIGYSFLNITDIKPPPFFDIAESSASGRLFTTGVALGYQIRPCGGILSRVELQYLHRGDVDYNANPFLLSPPIVIPNSINSTYSNDVVYLKAYYDFNLGYPVQPYIQGGGGLSFNHITGNATFDVFQTDVDNTSTFGAAEAGLGVRYNIVPSFWLDLGYQFEYLGKLRWDIQFPNPFSPPDTFDESIKSRFIYSNTILFGLTWQPMPKCPDDSDSCTS